MDDLLSFGSRDYFLMFGCLFFGRAVDFLSTWIATPNLVLEGNPLAKKLGWKWGALVNLGLCIGFGFWPVTAIIITTNSVLVAARNFQYAWLMRTMGEEEYRIWFVQRLWETRLPVFLFCLFGQTGLTALIGGAVMYFSNLGEKFLLVPFAIGLGIIGYACTVLFYTLLSVWRMRGNS